MKIELLVGMIASGKSTYARRRADEGALVISHDGLTSMLHAAYRYESWLRPCYREMEESLVKLAIEYERDVVIDRTHLTLESRLRWVHFASAEFAGHKPDVYLHAITFPIEAPEAHALRRFTAEARGRSYEDWLDVARHHSYQASEEPIGEGEGFDRIERRQWIEEGGSRDEPDR